MLRKGKLRLRHRSQTILNQSKLGNQRHPKLRHNRFGNKRLMFQNQNKLGGQKHPSLNQNKFGNLKMICQNKTFKVIQGFIKEMF
ncbi:hypothetical protein Hanom_Chr17g01579271 [Helianthus anomalus]